MRHFGICLLGVLVLAIAVRTGAVWVWFGNLSDDRDAYLVLADGLAAGHGFSVAGSDVPTAYRPPLYPLLLAVTGANDSPSGRAALHLLLGTATVWFTGILGLRLGLGARRALLAALLVAVDPLLVRYTTFPMTETLAAFLATALLLSIASPTGRFRDALIGLLFGLAVLVRPTFWVFGGLMLLWWIANRVFRRREFLGQFAHHGHPAAGEHRASRADLEAGRPTGAGVPWLTLVMVALTVSPWVVRNWLQLGSPVLMTTHGGYTLLLGNNPAFYREVVLQPWGTVWDGSVGGGQEEWVQATTRELQAAGITGEVAQDRWMSRRALEHIQSEPDLFVRACLLRLRRFWSLTPGGGDAAVLPTGLRLPLAGFYAAVFLLAAVGLVRAACRQWGIWAPSILLLAAFVAVHFVYWSNARMRAPVVPVILLLAARATTARSSPSADRIAQAV